MNSDQSSTTSNTIPFEIDKYTLFSMQEQKQLQKNPILVNQAETLTLGGLKFHHIKLGNQTYKWNSRSHRKLRLPEALNDKTRHPSKLRYRLRFLSWQPKIITWWNVWSGLVGITLWVINGFFLVWPDILPTPSKDLDVEIFIYRLGVCGSFLFIVGGYLEFVEAINHSHADLELPNSKINQDGENVDEDEKRKGREPRRTFKGTRPSTDKRVNHIDNLSQAEENKQSQKEELVNNSVTYLRLGSHVVKFNISGLNDEELKNKIQEHHAKSFYEVNTHHITTEEYVWWSWKPDIRHIGIFNAVVYFISTIIFFLPALTYLSFEENEYSSFSTFTYVYLPQIIASCGFIYSGYTGMAEVSGSWCAADCQSIGWWISFLNTVGGYGFLLFPLCGMPELFGPTNCCYVYTQWGANFASFWGSCSFFIASFLSCIEFASEHPITLTLNY